MRIAIDVRSLMEGRHSGVEEYTTEIIRSFLRLGGPSSTAGRPSSTAGKPSSTAGKHEYHLFYNSWKPVALPDFLTDGVTVHACRYPNKLWQAAQWGLQWPRWDSFIKADVFFVPNSRVTPLSSRAKLVTVAHDISFARFPEFLDTRRRVWHAMMSPRRLFAASDKVIAVSHHTKRDLVRVFGMRPEKIDVVYSGVRPMVLPSDPDLRRTSQKYGLPERFLLYLGAFEPRKNLAALVRAYSAIAPQVGQDLVLAGERGWRTKEMIREIAKSPARDRIHMIGFVAQEDKAALLTMADLFVYPSFYEGFGFPPLEALAAGTPVVTSFNSALPEVVGEWATLIDPYNAAEMALVLREVLNNLPKVTEDVRREIGRRYDWDEAGRRTLKILEEVVTRNA